MAFSFFPLEFGKCGALTEEQLEDKNCSSITAVKTGMLFQVLSRNVVTMELHFDKAHFLIISTPKIITNIQFTRGDTIHKQLLVFFIQMREYNTH